MHIHTDIYGEQRPEPEQLVGIGVVICHRDHNIGSDGVKQTGQQHQTQTHQSGWERQNRAVDKNEQSGTQQRVRKTVREEISEDMLCGLFASFGTRIEVTY